MEVQVPLWVFSELLFDFGDFVLGLLEAPGIREREISYLMRLVAEHVLEFESKLVLLIDEVVYFVENSTPFLLGVW